MITAFGTQRIAVEAMKAGAEDYLPKPFDNDELRLKVRKVMEKQLLKREHSQLLEQVRLETGVFENMVGRSRAMMRVFETIDKVAPTDVTVLIRGESGTGKELVARAIHFRSPRARKPFIAVNCAAFSRELVESELFGHEKGAFTGAVARREGKFEAADGGTLFLDEIGDMALETQAKLLRVLQEKRVRAHRRQSAAQRGRADNRRDQPGPRSDGRAGQVSRGPLLPTQGGRDSRAAASRAARRHSADGSAFHRGGMPAILRAGKTAHARGDARMRRGSVAGQRALAQGGNRAGGDPVVGRRDHRGRSVRRLGAGRRPRELAGAARRITPPAAANDSGDSELTFREAKEKFVGDWERDFFVRALRATGGNISRAAERTGMYRQSFQQKMRELGITLADLGLAPKTDAN